MKRRASTLLVLLPYIALGCLCIDLATVLWIEAGRAARPPIVVESGAWADRVCARLRREAARSCVGNADGLLLGGARWACTMAGLEREGAVLVAGTATLTRDAGRLVVRVTPRQGATREIWLWEDRP